MFSTIQEQRKLTNQIVQLEKLEKDSWRELDHKRLNFERRAERITNAKAIQRLSKSPSITPRGRRGGRIEPAKSSSSTTTHRNTKIKEKKKPRPSYASLFNPYRSNDNSYQEFNSNLGYAQHFTNRQLRKSSTSK